MPAANTTRFKRDFRIINQDGNTVTVAGRDLIYQIPNSLIAPIQTTNIITCIPANPVYWTGTRISALAQGYQNYRPQYMKITYVPQCAVTQQGNVIAGTLWNEAPESNNLQQSLRTSNGGMLTQCYKPASSIIKMKTNLQYNLFRIAGQFDQESNPFIYIAMAVGTTNANDQQVIPGYFYVTWKYILKNPIGNTNTYYNSGLILYKNINTTLENKTAIYLMIADNVIKCGTIIQLEDDGQYVVPKYNNSVIAPGENDVVWEFGNSSIAAAVQNSKTQNKIKIQYDTIIEEAETKAVIAEISESIQGKITIKLYHGAVSISAQPGKYITTAGLATQNFGTITALTATYTTFEADKTKYYLDYITQFKLPSKKNQIQQPKDEDEDEKEEDIQVGDENSDLLSEHS